MELKNTGELDPLNHLLGRIDKSIIFTFFYEKVEHLYCKESGPPPVDPTLLSKMKLLEYFYRIRSEHPLEQEAQVNVHYHWVLALSFSDSVPDQYEIVEYLSEVL
jgi:transposase